MTWCAFVEHGEHRCRCQKCGKEVAAPYGCHRVHRNCDVIDLNEIAAQRTPAGLGDVAARALEAIGVRKPRGCGCSKRQEMLNRYLPFSNTKLAQVSAARRAIAKCVRSLLRLEPRRTMLVSWPHGLGDSVQGTVLLRHLRHYYPDWTFDCQVKHGHTVFEGLARRTFVHGEPATSPYDFVYRPGWFDPHGTIYDDSPSTKAEKCLREAFQLQPIESLCRYQVTPTPDAWKRAAAYRRKLPERFAILHYQGNSAASAKNIDEHCMREIVRVLLARDVAPVVLDFETPHRSGLVGTPGTFTPAAGHPLWGGKHGTGDAAALAALASMSTLNLGIDSGPGHIFGSVDTPALILWGHHHPVQYYCLAPNVLHVLRRDHPSKIYGDADRGLAYFYAKYRHHVCQRNYRLELPELVERELSTC